MGKVIWICEGEDGTISKEHIVQDIPDRFPGEDRLLTIPIQGRQDGFLVRHEGSAGLSEGIRKTLSKPSMGIAIPLVSDSLLSRHA